jgi:cyclopropane-fatty-acyl-phospholipid synthase
MLLAYLLRHLVRQGTLRVVDAHGTVRSFAGEPGPTITIRLHDTALGYKLFLNPRLYLGEAFMDGTLTVEDATIFDFLNFAAINLNLAPRTALTPLYQGFGRAFRIFQQYNPLRRARANVAHHYDLSDTLYDLFLDADRQYSCAYFLAPDQSIETAQANKKRHIAAKLLLKPGQSVLDIGCGWGGLALYLAEICGARVTGITLSEEQYRRAQNRASERGHARDATFELVDYRDVGGRFDRIVSVGMFEHVGVGFYDAFFGKCAQLLDEDGVALLHFIGRKSAPGITNPWIAKYIFPGGYIPALSEVLPTIERAHLIVTDIEVLQLHYAETLKAWRERFLAHREEAERLYDRRFVRMWEFYLASSEMAFRDGDMVVFQIQMAKRKGVIPATRDYIAREEARLRGFEAGQVPPLRLAGE